MPKYRAVIERRTVSREIVELTATDINDALRRVTMGCDGEPRSRRGILTVRSHDNDPGATEENVVASIQERGRQ